jgi:hypothetical protein
MLCAATISTWKGKTIHLEDLIEKKRIAELVWVLRCILEIIKQGKRQCKTSGMEL